MPDMLYYFYNKLMIQSHHLAGMFKMYTNINTQRDNVFVLLYIVMQCLQNPCYGYGKLSKIKIYESSITNYIVEVFNLPIRHYHINTVPII